MIVSGVKNDNTSFGWNHATHRFITEKLVAKHNMGLPESMRLNYDILKYSCVEPDFSRKNITKYIHGHFADIDNLSDNPPDAYALAVKYTNKAIESHKNGNYGKRDDYLGYALHFIQDMLNPMHVEFVAVPKGHPERILHKEFETVAQSVMFDSIEKINTKGVDSPLPFFEKLLPQAMRHTKNLMNQIRTNDYSELSEIATKALDNTYKTTNLYLKKFMEQLYGKNISGLDVPNKKIPNRKMLTLLFEDSERISA